MSEKNSDKNSTDKSSKYKKTTDQDKYDDPDAKNSWETFNENAIPFGVMIFFSMVLFNQ